MNEPPISDDEFLRIFLEIEMRVYRLLVDLLAIRQDFLFEICENFPVVGDVRFFLCLLLTLASTAFAPRVAADEKQPAPALVETLSKHCMTCHGAKQPKADFRIDVILQDAPSDANLARWQDVLSRLKSRDMPPKDSPRPTEAEYETATSEIQHFAERLEVVALASQPRAIRRLNRREYANTIGDLFGIRFRPGDDFPPDGTLHGFDTVADGMNLAPIQVEKYLEAATMAVDRALRPDDPDRKPNTQSYAFYEEHFTYPEDSRPRGFSVYNGNATMFFGKDGKGRIVYIGGPAVFVLDSITPYSEHAFNSEGVYRLRAKMIPRNFDDGEVASFTLLNGRGKQIAERDIRITSDMNEIVIEAEADYDRSDMTSGFELNWTNGNHLQDPSRVKLLRLGFDGSDRSISSAR